jgi:hypothetical protein
MKQKSVKEILTIARNYFKYRKHRFAKRIFFINAETNSCCALGAVKIATRGGKFNGPTNPNLYHECCYVLAKQVPAQFRGKVSYYNDAPDTTKQDIINLFDKAIESVKE